MTVRGLKGSAGSFVARGLPRRPGDAGPQRRRARRRGRSALVVRLGPLAGVALRRRAAAARSRGRAAIGCARRSSSSSWARGALRQLAVVRLASRRRPRRGSVLCIRTIEEWNCITRRPVASTTSSARAWGRSSLTPDRRAASPRSASSRCSSRLGRPRPVPPHRRLGAAALDRLRAVLRSTRRSCSPSRRIVLCPLHVPGGTFIHSAVALAPHAYILALEGDRGRSSRGSRRAGRAWNRDDGDAAVHGLHRRDRRPSPRSRRRDRTSAGPGTAIRATAGRARAAARPRSASAPDDRILSIDARGLQVLDRPAAASSRPNDPIETIEQVAARLRHRAGSSLERDDIVRGARAGPRRRPAPAVDRAAGRSSIPGAGRRDARLAIVSRSASTPATQRCATVRVAAVATRREALVSRREVVLSAVLVFVVALLVRVLAASIVVFPQPEDTAYYVGVARNLARAAAASSSDAIWSFQTPPLVVPARPRSRSGCRCRRSSRPSRWRSSARRSRAAQVGVGRSSASLVPVLAWRLAADVADRARRCRGPRPDARGRRRADGGGLPAARPPLGPARLDDAVRGPRPRRPAPLMPRLLRGPRPRAAATGRPDRPRASSSGSPR